MELTLNARTLVLRARDQRKPLRAKVCLNDFINGYEYNSLEDHEIQNNHKISHFSAKL